MIRTRIALVVAAVAMVGVGSNLASAAPTSVPQLTDPSGDARALGASYDIVAGLMTTTGTTTKKKVGRKVVTTYKPVNLVASLTLAGPPASTPGSTYNFSMNTTACSGGSFSYSYTAGSLSPSIGDLFISGCGTPGTGTGPAEFMKDVKAAISGNTITWTMPLADLGSDLPLSTVFSGFTAETDLNDPYFGLFGTGVTSGTPAQGALSIDTASSAASWKLG